MPIINHYVHYVSKCILFLYVCIIKDIFSFFPSFVWCQIKQKTFFLIPENRIGRCLYNDELAICSWIILTTSVFEGRSKQKGTSQFVSLPKGNIDLSFKEKQPFAVHLIVRVVVIYLLLCTHSKALNAGLIFPFPDADPLLRSRALVYCYVSCMS